MKAQTKRLLKRIAINTPGAALLSYGMVSALTGNHDGGIAGEVGIGYIGLILALRESEREVNRQTEKDVENIANHAEVIRPPVENLGAYLNISSWRRYLDDTQQARLDSMIHKLVNMRELRQGERVALGFGKHQAVFMTEKSVIALNGHRDEIRDLVKASAAGAFLLDEGSKRVPLFKPMAIRAAVALGQYPTEPAARTEWNFVYDELRGKRLLREAYKEFSSKGYGGVIMDGPLALNQRGGIVLPYGDYRYIGFDKIEGVETQSDAWNAVRMLMERGIYDADRKRFVRLHPFEQARIAENLIETEIYHNPLPIPQDMQAIKNVLTAAETAEDADLEPPAQETVIEDTLDVEVSSMTQSR